MVLGDGIEDSFCILVVLLSSLDRMKLKLQKYCSDFTKSVKYMPLKCKKWP